MSAKSKIEKWEAEIEADPELQKKWIKMEAILTKFRGRLSTILPPATKPAKSKSKKEEDELFEGAVILFDWASRKREVPPVVDWPARMQEALSRGLIECDPGVFLTMAKAAAHMRDMERKRTKHAEHVSTMILVGADHMRKTGEKPSKKDLIEKTHKVLTRAGKDAMPTDSPQLWTPVISAAGFGKCTKSRSQGSKKKHGDGYDERTSGKLRKKL